MEASNMKKIYYLIVSVFAISVFGGNAYGIKEPPHITIDKPTPKTIKYIDASGNGDYSTFEEADEAFSELVAPVKYIIRSGVYEGFFWDSSGVLGSEIVFEMAENDNATVMNSGTTTTIGINAKHIIFDGGEDRRLTVDGSNGTGDHYMVRLRESNGCGNVTFSRVVFTGAHGSVSGKNIVPEADSLKFYNCIIEQSLHNGFYLSNGDHIEIKNNIIRNNGGVGIYANPHSTGYSVDELVISGNMIFGNGFTSPYGTQPGMFLYSQADALYDVYIYNNIIWGNSEEGFRRGSGNSSSNIRFYNNTVYGNGNEGILIESGSTVIITNNISYGNGDSDTLNTSTVTNHLATNPTFLSTDSQNDNFLKISSVSQAKDAGSDLSQVFTTDYFGGTRFGEWDIGAHEYGASFNETNASPDGTINNPSGDVTINIGDKIDFSGTGSDTDNNLPLSYLWQFGTNSGIPDSTLETPGEMQFNNAGTYNVTLTVTDAEGLADSTPAACTVTVNSAGESESDDNDDTVTSPSELYSQPATITITPSDNYTKIESAQSGDIVEIAPGTYKFRVFLGNSGTASQPIIIRAQDPNNRPVWDLDGMNCSEWPGSYSGGDLHRGAWQISGDHYQLYGIVFKNSKQTSGIGIGDSAGIRIRGGNNITIGYCHFEGNDNGVQGYGENILYEHCVMMKNGSDGSGEVAHNIYTHGGSQTFRYCFISSPLQGQNLHLRGKNFRFEYCWIENERTYMGDLMVSTTDWAETSSLDSTLTIVGCVIIGAEAPINDTKLFTLYNDPNRANVRMTINMYYNTIIGNGENAAVVRFTNSGMVSQRAYLYNNIFYGVHRPFHFDTTSGVTAVSENNWWPSGYDYSFFAQYMTDTVFGSDPGFISISQNNFRLLESSGAIDNADKTKGTMPSSELVRSGTNIDFVARAATNDLGAFEYAAEGGADTPPAPTLYIQD